MGWERNATFLFAFTCVMTLVSILWPHFLSDQNGFLKGFVDQDLLSFLGIILTISLGFIAQLNLLLGKLLKHLEKSSVDEVRSELKHTSKSLIALFFVGIFLALTKPLIVGNQIFEIIVNCSALFVVLFFFLILADIVLSILDFDI